MDYRLFFAVILVIGEVYSDVAVTDCVTDGRIFKRGLIKGKECNICTCSKFGHVICTQYECRKGEGCPWREFRYVIGAIVKKDCTICTCNKDKQWLCTLKICQTPNISNTRK